MNNWACATNFSVIRKRSGATLIEPNSLTTREIYTDDFAAKGLAVFGGTLQSDNFNAANNTGWCIQKNGTLNMPKAFVQSAHLGNAVIKGAHIGDLEVDTLKIKNNAVSVFHNSFTAGNTTVTPNNPVWGTVQSLTFTPGRASPRLVTFYLEFVSGLNWHIRLISRRGSTESDLYYARPPLVSDEWRPAFNETHSGKPLTVLDRNTSTAAVTYELQVSTASQSGVFKNRFLGAFDAFK